MKLKQYTVAIAVAASLSIANAAPTPASSADNTATCNHVTVAGELAAGIVCAVDHTIPVRINGEFGSAASLVISGPQGGRIGVTLTRLAQGCSYDFNWQMQQDAPAGQYIFTITGNNNATYQFAVSVVKGSDCSKVPSTNPTAGTPGESQPSEPQPEATDQPQPESNSSDPQL